MFLKIYLADDTIVEFSGVTSCREREGKLHVTNIVAGRKFHNSFDMNEVLHYSTRDGKGVTV